jgi:release factor glutamine methyltransferase
MTIDHIRKRSIERLRKAGMEDARICVDWLIEHVTGVTRVDMLANPDIRIPEHDQNAIAVGLARRLAGEPIQYVLGWTEFYGLRLDVSPDVLIPRPETEVVVEAVLEQVGDRSDCHILDVGTGSGCIALAIASRRPSARVEGCDISQEAVTVAQRNADRLRLPTRFLVADMERPEAIASCGSDFDIIVSNPPYIPTSELPSLPREVRRFEPAVALTSGDDPLRFYRALVERATESLVVGGRLIAELHADFSEEVVSVASAGGLSNVEIRPDLAGLPRVILATREGT